MALSLHAVIDDEVMLSAFHDFVARYHAEETLMFWLAVEVFKHRNWKAAKFFGMDTDPGPIAKVPIPVLAPTPTKKSEAEKRKSRKEKNSSLNAALALKRQRQLDQSAANRMSVSLEQLYLVKEADFIFDNFIRKDGAYWTCIDAQCAQDIETKLMDPSTLQRNLFDKAQLQAFNGMNDDLMPRFMKEISFASERDPIPADMKDVCNRYDELRKGPNRRKTGVSTALAFAFKRGPSSERDAKLQTISSRDMGRFDREIDAGKASEFLRQRSHLSILGSEGGTIGALALSRSRLSQNSSEMTKAIAEAEKELAISIRSKKKSQDLKVNRHISAPARHAGHESNDSFGRKMEIGLHRSRSDGSVLVHGTHIRAKELGANSNFGHLSSRNTASKLIQGNDGETLTLFFETSGPSRKISI